MLARSVGTVLLSASASSRVGLMGIAAFWAVLPRNSNTSPRAAIFTLAWSWGAYVAAGVLTWRRSQVLRRSGLCRGGRIAGDPRCRSCFPVARSPILPEIVVISLLAFLGYRLSPQKYLCPPRNQRPRSTGMKTDGPITPGWRDQPQQIGLKSIQIGADMFLLSLGSASKRC